MVALTGFSASGLVAEVSSLLVGIQTRLSPAAGLPALRARRFAWSALSVAALTASMHRFCRIQLCSLILVCAAFAVENSNTAPAQSTGGNSAGTLPPQSVSAQHMDAADKATKEPITVFEETLIRVMTNEPVDSKRAKDGDSVLFTVSEEVTIGDLLAIPRGATVHGVVVKSKKAGRLTGSPELTLQLTSLDLGGRSYPLFTHLFKVKGASKTRPTETKAIRGAAVGALVEEVGGLLLPAHGFVESAGTHAADVATMAGVGAGVGTAVSALSPGPGIRIPAESQLDFYLAAPITVTPVSAKEAARLSRGLYPGGPTLYVRGESP